MKKLVLVIALAIMEISAAAFTFECSSNTDKSNSYTLTIVQHEYQIMMTLTDKQNKSFYPKMLVQSLSNCNGNSLCGAEFIEENASNDSYYVNFYQILESDDKNKDVVANKLEVFKGHPLDIGSTRTSFDGAECTGEGVNRLHKMIMSNNKGFFAEYLKVHFEL